MPHPIIITVILNTNRREDTLECLGSLRRNSYDNHEIIVLDNASTDGSVRAIGTAFPEVDVVPLRDNLGYAGNNNVGIKLALERNADWIVLLNEDTVLAPDCVQRLVSAGESSSDIGIVGPMIYHHDEPDVIQTAGGRLGRYWRSTHIGITERDHGQYARTREVEWVSGCCIMIRRAVIERIGAIDERYFYYWEETELCVRARREGWKIVHVPKAKMWHKGVRRNYKPQPSVTYYATRNRLLTLSKHRAPLVARMAAWGEVIRTLAVWSVRPRWRHMKAHRNAMLLGVRDLLLHRWGKMPERP